MINYIVIGICILLLLLVIFISAKPISMGIEARREIKDNKDPEDDEIEKFNETIKNDNFKISDEINKLNDLRVKGILTEEEYKSAKKKLLD